jgi:hypothetical protein
MKSQINPAVGIGIVVVVALGAIFMLWRGSLGVNKSGGRMQSDLDFSKIEKDPEKLKKELEESIRKSGAK